MSFAVGDLVRLKDPKKYGRNPEDTFTVLYTRTAPWQTVPVISNLLGVECFFYKQNLELVEVNMRALVWE